VGSGPCGRRNKKMVHQEGNKVLCWLLDVKWCMLRNSIRILHTLLKSQTLQRFLRNDPETGTLREQAYSGSLLTPEGLDVATRCLYWMGANFPGVTTIRKAAELVTFFNACLACSVSLHAASLTLCL
jgi:hypothetical protein